MKNVIQLVNFKSSRQRQYLQKHQRRINNFIAQIVPELNSDIAELSWQYQKFCTEQARAAWDYMEFREFLHTLVAQSLGKVVYEQMRREFWFDSRWLTEDIVTDRCVSVLVLGPAMASGETP